MKNEPVKNIAIYQAKSGAIEFRKWATKTLKQHLFEGYTINKKRIVSILDKFDALVNDIFVGLPDELNVRRQQYEYYRNKLLTFKKYES